MVSKSAIDVFFEGKTVAIAGVSRNPKKFPSQVYIELKKKGYTVVPENPNSSEVMGEKTFSSVAELPPEINSLLIITNKQITEQIVEEAIKKGIQNIWIQQMSQTPAAIEKAKEAGINLVYKQCVFMFAEPVAGMHRFHRSMKKLFGQLPK